MKRKIFSAEHEALRETFVKFIADELIPNYPVWEKTGQIPREVWRKAGARGFLAAAAPEELGGAGADFLYSVVLSEELNRAAVSGFYLPLHNDIVLPYILELATPEKKREWVRKCVSGEVILALALTEPNVGSDLAQLQTKARRDGDVYILDGAKTFISNGQSADLVVVAARTEPTAKPAHRGVSLFVVDSKTPGFRRGRNLDKIGLHAQDTSELFFENCRVPASHLLGEANQGWTYLMQNLQQERLVIAVGAAAAAEGCLNLTLIYVTEREAFGKPLAELDAVRLELAEIATKVQVTRSFVDDLIPRHIAGEELVKEVSMAKAWATDIQFEVADRCLQLFGGYGYMREYPVSRHFVDARVQRIYGGANEIMRELVARRLFTKQN